MKCEEAREHLSAYLDEMLEQDLKVRLEDHLSKCERCTQELSELRNIIESISSLDPIKAPSDFLDNVKKRLEPGFSLPKFIKTIFLPLQIKIPIQAAAVAVSVLLVFALVQQLQRSTDEFPRPTAPEPMRSAEVLDKESLDDKPKPSKGKLEFYEVQKLKRPVYKKDTADETAPDRRTTGSERSMKTSKMAKKEVLQEQSGPGKEGVQNDLALTREDSKKIYQKIGSGADLETEPMLKKRLEFEKKKKELQLDGEMKGLPKVEPVELVVFIGPAKPTLNQAKAMEAMKKSEETSDNGIAEKEEVRLARQRILKETEIKERSLEEHREDQDSAPRENVSELATGGTLADIQRLVFESKGKIITTFQSDQPTIPSLIKTEIPVTAYKEFCSKIKMLSPQTLCSSVDIHPSQNMIPVNIKIFQN
jgi:hypothetical protein